MEAVALMTLIRSLQTQQEGLEVLITEEAVGMELQLLNIPIMVIVLLEEEVVEEDYQP